MKIWQYWNVLLILVFARGLFVTSNNLLNLQNYQNEERHNNLQGGKDRFKGANTVQKRRMTTAAAAAAAVIRGKFFACSV